MKYLLFVLALFCLSCGRRISGQVFGDHFPYDGALVSTDSSPKTVKTGQNGYFSFRVRTKGKTCRIMAWVADTTKRIDVTQYTFGGGRIDLRIQTRK